MKKNFEKGFSEDSLKNAWKLYLTYKDRIDETGMLEAKRGKAFADNLFEIPKLYRIGLGLVLRGRP